MSVLLADSAAGVPPSVAITLALIAPLVAVIVAFLTSELTRRRDAKREIKDYLHLLKATRAELVLLRGIVATMRNDVFKSYAGLSGPGAKTIFHPSYGFDAAYFEKLKFELARTRVTAALMQRVGSSHFEFVHIRDRFEASKALLRGIDLQTAEQAALSRVVAILAGFMALIEQDMPGFEEAEAELNSEIGAVETELREFSMTPPFSAY